MRANGFGLGSILFNNNNIYNKSNLKQHTAAGPVLLCGTLPTHHRTARPRQGAASAFTGVQSNRLRLLPCTFVDANLCRRDARLKRH
ncbi:hypothetical protein SAMN04488020_103211 [Palleronia marisminoris]|uniref:Uncharacterized protein n=1 Tax=Palleronia marisminoris TaxID=315423 RepID=A0A1Y5SBU1_9RHOB|nr:hypothetical protein SAMN04488020_103211 [Palleronia marisminoris]SLN35617.1 hypothetical protein PAM7066_01491 [Palleronia marisminoris]